MSEHYELFHYDGCGYCYRVRGYLASKNLNVTLRNIHEDRTALPELLSGGGRRMVPCLKIQRGNDTFWMYESADIIEYLEGQFASG